LLNMNLLTELLYRKSVHVIHTHVSICFAEIVFEFILKASLSTVHLKIVKRKSSFINNYVK